MIRLRLLFRFLRDRLPFVILYFLNTVILVALIILLLSFQEVNTSVLADSLPYALLLSATMLLLWLGIDLLRWWPYAAQADQLLQEEVALESLVNLPPGNSFEQRESRALMVKLYQLAMREQVRSQRNHQQHLDFLNMWVHQMKTPVSSLYLLTQRAADTENEDERDELFSNVAEEAEKLNEGLELILNMARLEDFALDYHLIRLDLVQSVRRVINARKKQFIRLGIFPEIVVPEGELFVVTDMKWNDVVIDQLVSNALKYASQKTMPNQRLKFEFHHEPDFVTLTITDQGPGIPPEDLPRIFEPFFTGENGRVFANATGIGLHLVRQVLGQLDHQIAVASTLGVGTSVTLRYDRQP